MTPLMTVQYGSTPPQTADLYLPDTDTQVPVVCLLHGGFWRVPHGREQFHAIAIDHLAGLREQGHHLDLERVVVVGHSAGGQLALAAASGATPGITPSRVRLRAVCSQAGLCDLEQAFAADAGQGEVREFLGGAPDQCRERYLDASPVRRLPHDARVLVLHGRDDEAVPLAMSRNYAESARAAGCAVELIEIPAAGHMEFLEPASVAHAHLRDWLERTAFRAS